MGDFLPYGRQQIEDDDVAAVSNVLRGDWLTTGPAVGEFEDRLAAAVDAKHAVACSSGTAALHLAALAAGFGAGDAAVVPSMTFVATANCVRYVGGEVLLADVDADHGLLQAQEIARLVRDAEETPKAAFPVHLNGQCCDMAAIAATARTHGLTVIEDASHALGTIYRHRGEAHAIGSCSHSDMCVFSFHPVKTIAMGEGGAVTTNDDGLADRLRDLRTHGITRAPSKFTNRDMAFDREGAPHRWYYEAQELGFNYRASDIHCALGTSQLGKLQRFAEQRRKLVREYDLLVQELAPLVRPVSRVAWSEAVWHLYAVHIDFAGIGRTRDEIVARLLKQGIGTQVHYIPVHRQPYYEARYGRQSLPGAEAYYDTILSLPLFAAMTEGDVGRVVAALGEAVNRS